MTSAETKGQVLLNDSHQNTWKSFKCDESIWIWLPKIDIREQTGWLPEGALRNPRCRVTHSMCFCLLLDGHQKFKDSLDSLNLQSLVKSWYYLFINWLASPELSLKFTRDLVLLVGSKLYDWLNLLSMNPTLRTPSPGKQRKIVARHPLMCFCQTAEDPTTPPPSSTPDSERPQQLNPAAWV